MEKEINIAEILKDCPKGTMLYSLCYGYVEFMFIRNGYIVAADHDNLDKVFFINGSICEEGECMLFPSKDHRDWSKFVRPVVPPFDIKRANDGGDYYILDSCYRTIIAQEDFVEADNLRFENGNYFNSLEQAEYAAGKVKELLLSMRKEVKQ